VEVHVVDRDGSRVPDAGHTITFEVAGAGRLIAVDNADLSDSSPVQANQRKAYQGRAVAVVRSGSQPGKVTIRATSPGLTPGEAVVGVEP
jgi:beta-galactosidase